MSSIYNFSAGPAALPPEVIAQAQQEFGNWHNSGLSVLEIGHRSAAFVALAEQIQSDLRELLNIPKNYQILLLPDGATYQFSWVPMNLLRGNKQADYVNTGVWSQKALVEAKRYCEVNIVASNAETGRTTIPAQARWALNKNAAYVHYTANETIDGLEFSWLPNVGTVPLVSDMSSTLLSMPLDIKHFGLIYAGGQKNLGANGLTLVIVREDLLGNALPLTPTLGNYQVQAENHSLYNTPPTYAWYLLSLMLRWVQTQGGVVVMAERNKRKAEKLYRFIDNSDLYSNNVDPCCRSRMNVIFRLRKPELEKKFLLAAEQRGLLGLHGHRLVGGLRASLYNAMPEAGVDALLEFMEDFEKNM
jgi:phosphoserine aminotransferase